MIDIHSHLLPGVDDGAPTLQASIDMLDAYVANGFVTVATTPHLTGRLDVAYRATVDHAFAQVEPLARERGISLVRGFEVRLEPDLPKQLQRGEPIALSDTNVVLIDLPFTEWPMYADATLFAVQTAGYRVVLAHPERYPGIQDNPAKATELVSRGIVLQVTIGSFSGAFGKRAKRCAETLLELGVVQVVATDAHSAGHRMAAVPAGMERLRKLVGQAQLETLTVMSPAMLLNGDAAPPPVHPVRSSWRDRIPSLRR
jgi:protein-tyrosine phosphatase